LISRISFGTIPSGWDNISLELRKNIMDEIHKMPYYGNLSSWKLIDISKKQYFWLGMKKDVVEYIIKCMECWQVKVEH